MKTKDLHREEVWHEFCNNWGGISVIESGLHAVNDDRVVDILSKAYLSVD